MLILEETKMRTSEIMLLTLWKNNFDNTSEGNKLTESKKLHHNVNQYSDNTNELCGRLR